MSIASPFPATYGLPMQLSKLLLLFVVCAVGMPQAAVAQTRTESSGACAFGDLKGCESYAVEVLKYDNDAMSSPCMAKGWGKCDALIKANLQKACKQNGGLTCDLLASDYGTQRKDVVRPKLIAQCTKDYWGACLRAGDLELDLKKPQAAMPLYRRACDAGLAGGCYELARLEKGREQAKLFEKGCELGEPLACEPVIKARCKSEGSKACKSWRQKETQAFGSSCQLGNKKNCIEASVRYYQGKLVKKDVQKELKHRTNGCYLGDGGSCTEAGLIHKAKYPDIARGFLNRGCVQGDSLGCFEYAVLVSGSNKTKRLTKEGFKYMQKACDMNLPSACMTLAGQNCLMGSTCTSKELTWALKAVALTEDKKALSVVLYGAAETACKVGDNSAKALWQRACKLEVKDACNRKCSNRKPTPSR